MLPPRVTARRCDPPIRELTLMSGSRTIDLERTVAHSAAWPPHPISTTPSRRGFSPLVTGPRMQFCRPARSLNTDRALAERPQQIAAECGCAKFAPATPDAPLVSVIIPHYNDMDRLSDCLRLLQEQTLPPHQFEIVVADNNSRCGLKEVERICGATARVVPAIQGAGLARNVAIAASRGSILAFTDSDCRPSRTWLERGVAAVAVADMVGGRVDVDIEHEFHPTAVEAFEKGSSLSISSGT
jgi:hypothetical protein